jgi:hypothetical protein
MLECTEKYGRSRSRVKTRVQIPLGPPHHARQAYTHIRTIPSLQALLAGFSRRVLRGNFVDASIAGCVCCA